MLKIILISGDGQGAGKTTLAAKLGQQTLSLASAMRAELQRKYPTYNWYNKEQEYKDTTIIKEHPGQPTLRRLMIDYGQEKCLTAADYWARELVNYIKDRRTYVHDGVNIFAVDDVRKVCEKRTILEAFPGAVTHIHISYPGAVFEPEYDNEDLRQDADYILHRDGT